MGTMVTRNPARGCRSGEPSPRPSQSPMNIRGRGNIVMKSLDTPPHAHPPMQPQPRRSFHSPSHGSSMEAESRHSPIRAQPAAEFLPNPAIPLPLSPRQLTRVRWGALSMGKCLAPPSQPILFELRALRRALTRLTSSFRTSVPTRALETIFGRFLAVGEETLGVVPQWGVDLR